MSVNIVIVAAVVLFIVFIAVGFINMVVEPREKARNELEEANITASYTLWNGPTKNQAVLFICYNIPEADKEKIKPEVVRIYDAALQGVKFDTELVFEKRQFGDRTSYNCAVETVPKYRDLEITLQLDNGRHYIRTDKILVST